MKGNNHGIAIKFAVVSTVVCTSLIPAQPASAQLLELATGAVGIVKSIVGGKSKPQPAPQPVIMPQRPISASIPDFTVGAGNLNGNTLNLCISGCLPQATPPRQNPYNTFPSANTTPPGTIAQPGTAVISQPVPNRP